ncbi:ATP-binding protein [Paenibacillus thermotolerans]|uniref:ATP-binding protein n=1 Tax=Paenibacillus thermotolerans TaxID=3027807 RepID=UPI002368A37C|nr:MULTISPECIES: ATP-binding protein [unclassified Paenibacillus]
MLGIDNLLLNFLFILVSVLTYFSLGLYRSKWNKLLIGIFGSLSVMFCMSFPFTVFPGYIYDLRIIPFVVTIAYGGFESGSMVALVLILYRYHLGGIGFEATLLSYLPLYLIMVLFSKFLRHSSKSGQIAAGTLASLSSAVFVAASSMMKSYEALSEQFGFFIYYCLLVGVCAWITMFIIVTMLDNIRMREEIHRAEKLYVLGELAATIAHEIRNPMTVAKGFLQLLKHRMNNDTDTKYSTFALEEIDRAESIISEYLLFAKPQAEKIETVHVKDLIANVVNIIEPYVTSHNHIARWQAEESLYVKADSKKLTQVMVNIIKNGVEAMEHSGEITIRAFRKGDKVAIKIADTGVGMTKDQIAKLGSPFYSTKSKGTGLGLMVSYRIIESIDGEIIVESEKGKGTTFCIIVPQS